jgi:hypothetical protein
VTCLCGILGLSNKLAFLNGLRRNTYSIAGKEVNYEFSGLFWRLGIYDALEELTGGERKDHS